MPRGQVLVIPNMTAQLVTTLSREQKDSIALLNPNDGILYVKLNGPANNSPTMWDWKVPSQSYCQLPGPWNSLGVFYLDQSGSGRTAEVNIYESDTQISLPSFIAIGRAVQQAGTTVDISQGGQPANPPASTSRLWIDGTGQLHVLDATGHDETYVDTTYPLGGDIFGTIPNAHISLIYGNRIAAQSSDGIGHSWLSLEENNVNFWNAGGGTFYWWPRDNPMSNALAYLDSNGNFMTDKDIQASSISLIRGNNQVIYWRDGSHYLQYAPAGNLNLLAWTHDFQARQLYTQNSLGGALTGTLPSPTIANGGIPYAGLATDARARFVYNYNNTSNWSTTSTGWIRTPITFTATIVGGKAILWTWNVHWFHNGTNASPEFGLACDSAGTFFQQMSVQQNSFANQAQTCAGAHIFYLNEVPSGTHTFDFYVYNASGTFSLWGNDRHYMSIAELPMG